MDKILPLLDFLTTSELQDLRDEIDKRTNSTNDSYEKLIEAWFPLLHEKMTEHSDIRKTFYSTYRILHEAMRWQILPGDCQQCGKHTIIHQLVISNDVEYCDDCFIDDDKTEFMENMDKWISEYDEWNFEHQQNHLREIFDVEKQITPYDLEIEDKWVKNVDTELSCEQCFDSTFTKYTCIFGGEILCESCLPEFSTEYEKRSFHLWVQ